MEKQVQEAIDKIEKNDWIEPLRQCPDLKARYDKLVELLPETWLWSPMPARQLIFYLQRKYGLEFGVCPHYEIEGYKQYCSESGEKIECLCVIPQPYCKFRDKDSPPKYPGLLLRA